MNNLQPSQQELEELGQEILQASERNREAIAKADPRWQHNADVYAAQRSWTDAGLRAERWGLDIADRSEARDSWQSQLSESGRPLGNFSEPFQLLTRSQVQALRKVARSAKGKRRLALLVAQLREAARA